MAFTEATFDFLRDLAAHNEKGWFDASRDRYETHWKTAALDFIADVSEGMAALKPPLTAEAKLNGSLRRINRDVRFSVDKSPYNAHLHMIFWSGSHANRAPAVHIVLHPDGVGYGAGRFGLQPADLAAIRTRIVDKADGEALIAALASAETVGCSMGAPDLARLPNGHEAEGRRAELLRHKAIVARTFDRDAPPSVLIGKDAVRWTMDTTGALMPLVRWLAG